MCMCACACVKEISKWVKNVISGFNKKKNTRNDVTIVVVLRLGLSPTLSCLTFFILPNM